MAKLISIISGKGGVGKTTTSVNIGVCLNQFGKEVILVDANLTTPNLGLHLGAPIVPVSLNHVLQGKARISDAIYEHESGTKLIPSSLSVRELSKINHSKLKEVGKKLKKLSVDYVIYDGAAGLGDEAIGSIDAADEIILVTNPEVPAVTDALKAIKFAEQRGKRVRGVIVTRVRGTKAEMSVENVRDILEVPVLGVVPEDPNMQFALAKKDAIVHLHPRSRSSLAYKRIAANISGIRYKTPSLISRILG